MSQILIDLSAEPDKASRPSGEISVLRTHDECPVNEATAPEPGFPEAETRTSCRINLLSSDADNSKDESGDHARALTAMACDVYVADKLPDSRSNMYIWPVSDDMATRVPSGLWVQNMPNLFRLLERVDLT